MQAAFRRALYNVLSQKIYRFKEQELSDCDAPMFPHKTRRICKHFSLF